MTPPFPPEMALCAPVFSDGDDLCPDVGVVLGGVQQGHAAGGGRVVPRGGHLAQQGAALGALIGLDRLILVAPMFFLSFSSPTKGQQDNSA